MKKGSRNPAIRLYDDEAVIDLFAGGGGASTGIEMILGRSPDVAINHNKEALAMHQANHPTTLHLQEDVFDVDPVFALNGKRCGLLWLSPDCKYFSKAKGGAPFRDPNRARRVRGLIGVALKWAANPRTRPRMMFVENVEEIEFWCPIGPDGRPDATKRGRSFQRWVARLRNLGGDVQWRQIRGCDFGAPTTRKRLFIIVRFDGQPIVWPEPTHGPRRKPHHALTVLGSGPHRIAAECINFSMPVPSIFLTPAEAKAWGKRHGLPAPRRPLAHATLRRIARGVDRFVIRAAEPFIVPVVHSGDDRIHSVFEPLRTIVASDREFALVAPVLTKYHGRRRSGDERGHALTAPIATLDTSNRFGLVTAFLAKHNGGHEATGQPIETPLDTITTRDQKALVTSSLVKLYGTCRDGQAIDAPMPTVTAEGNHIAEVRAFLVKFYGSKKDGKPLHLPLDTVTTKERFGLVIVTIAGEEYVMVDIGMRMLTPRELFLAQGFPPDYKIDIEVEQRLLSKKAQTRLCGNSVNPQVAAALIGANAALPMQSQGAA